METIPWIWSTQLTVIWGITPHLSLSDHITVMLIPAYGPQVKVSKPGQMRYKCDQRELPQPFRTALLPLTGTCLSRQPPMTIRPAFKNTQRQLWPISPNAWMMSAKPGPSSQPLIKAVVYRRGRVGRGR